MASPADLAAATDQDLYTAATAIAAERQRRDTVASYPGRIQQAQEAMLSTIPTDPAAVPAYDAGTTYQPGAAVSYQGKVWWNPAGVNLHGATPGDAAHPYWALRQQPGESVEAWDYKTTILVNGRLYSDASGKVWRYLGTTKTAPTGDPNQGPMDNANWQAVS